MPTSNMVLVCYGIFLFVSIVKGKKKKALKLLNRPRCAFFLFFSFIFDNCFINPYLFMFIVL